MAERGPLRMAGKRKRDLPVEGDSCPGQMKAARHFQELVGGSEGVPPFRIQ